MTHGVSMLARVPVRRAIATKGGTALLAGPQVYPVSANLYALFAFPDLRLFYRRDRLDMRTGFLGHAGVYESCRKRSTDAIAATNRQNASLRRGIARRKHMTEKPAPEQENDAGNAAECGVHQPKMWRRHLVQQTADATH